VGDADAAMYRAKRRGRARFEFFDNQALSEQWDRPEEGIRQ
jgi:hypothetical protein